MASLVTLPGTYEYIGEFADPSGTGKTWRNTFEYQAPGTPFAGDAVDLIMQQLLSRLLPDAVNIIGRAVYNWARGTHPYPSGSPIWKDSTVIPGSGNSYWYGAPPTAGEWLGGEVCVRCDRETGPGKPGRLFLRGLPSITEIGVPFPSNKWALLNAGGGVGHINDAALQKVLLDSGGLTLMKGASGPGVFVVVRYSPKLHEVFGADQVEGIHVIDATTNKQTRKNKK